MCRDEVVVDLGTLRTVKSMLKTVAENVITVITVIASLILNVANPNDWGLKPAVDVVGCVGGFS